MSGPRRRLAAESRTAMLHPCQASIDRQTLILREAVGAELARGGAWSLTDFPNYANIGDSAIWVGLHKVLTEISGRKASHLATNSPSDFKAETYRNLGGPVFFVGGGNFGDLYPRHQQYKLAVLAARPGRRVVQLSQSAHFKNPAAVRETAAAIKAHGNFCFFARDRETFAFISDAFDCEVKLVPDGAFGMGALARSRAPTMETLQFRRADIESVAGPVEGSIDWPVEDYERDIRPLEWPGRLHHLLHGRFSAVQRRRATYNTLAQWRLDRGIDILSGAKMIVCDRLHVHILSTLLGIPHTFLDNSTGKITAYYEAWTHDCPVGRPDNGVG